MKRLLTLVALSFWLSFLGTAWSQTSSLTDLGLPHTINLQSIVYDRNGKVTTSDKVDVAIKILDADSNVVFSEDHSAVQVIEGAINLEIGS